MEEQPTSDERFLGSMCYWGSLLVNMLSGGFGFLVPIVIFFLKRDESPFLKKEAMKAIIASVIIFILVIMAVITGVIISIVTFGLGFIIFVPVASLIALAILIYKIYLACEVYKGRSPYIPLVSDLADKCV